MMTHRSAQKWASHSLSKSNSSVNATQTVDMSKYLSNIIDSANEGMYVTDVDRRFLVWNEAASKISGYKKNEIIGHFCFDNVLSHSGRDGEELCHGRCPLQASIEEGAPRGPVIVYLRHKSGKRIAVEVKTAPVRNDEGIVIGGVEVFQDVTERLERERLLQERKEKLETVLDSIGDGILFLDTEGRINVVNHACAKLLDLKKEAKGSVIHDLPVQAPLRQALSDIERAFKRSLSETAGDGGTRCPQGRDLFRCWNAGIDRSPLAPSSACYTCETYRRERTFLEKPSELNWGERTFSVVSSFIEMHDTNELWEVIAFRDVTAEKLDAALRVAGAAAHELRQPLQVIVILAGLLEHALEGNVPLQKHVDGLMDNCERMDHIISKMCKLTRYETKEYVDGIKILDFNHSSNKK